MYRGDVGACQEKEYEEGGLEGEKEEAVQFTTRREGS